MLHRMANRGGRLLTDYPGFPPSRVMVPLKKKGLVELTRECAAVKTRRNIWVMTPKGWSAIDRTPPEPAE